MKYPRIEKASKGKKEKIIIRFLEKNKPEYLNPVERKLEEMEEELIKKGYNIENIFYHISSTKKTYTCSCKIKDNEWNWEKCFLKVWENIHNISIEESIDSNYSFSYEKIDVANSFSYNNEIKNALFQLNTIKLQEENAQLQEKIKELKEQIEELEKKEAKPWETEQ